MTAMKHSSCYQHILGVSLAMLVAVLTLFIFYRTMRNRMMLLSQITGHREPSCIYNDILY